MSYGLSMTTWGGPVQAQDAGAGTLASVTAGSAPTYSAYAQIVASTNFAASAIDLTFYAVLGTSSVHVIFKFAIGGAGSEVDFLVDVPLTTLGQSPDALYNFIVPVEIPKGSRISFAAASDTGSVVCYASVQLIAGTMGEAKSGQTPNTYGVTTSTARGITLTSGASFAKGSYVQLTASCKKTTSAILLPSTNEISGQPWYMDIAVGGSGSETIIAPDITFKIYYNVCPNSWWLPISVPAGSRLSARVSSAFNTDTIDVALIGFN
jgi:hypothetical protein